MPTNTRDKQWTVEWCWPDVPFGWANKWVTVARYDTYERAVQGLADLQKNHGYDACNYRLCPPREVADD